MVTIIYFLYLFMFNLLLVQKDKVHVCKVVVGILGTSSSHKKLFCSEQQPEQVIQQRSDSTIFSGHSYNDG